MQRTFSILKKSVDKTSLNSAPKLISFFKPVIQPKLTINQPNDVYEQEADAVADKVMSMREVESMQTNFLSSHVSKVHRKCEQCEEEKKMQRKEKNSEETSADDGFENYINNLGNSGQPMPGKVRDFYEPRFGYDFSNVRIHSDQVAAKSAQSVNALAYTSGNDIVFNSGQYSPNTESGKRLLGHELTHVVQSNQQRKTISDPEISKRSAAGNVIYRVPQEPTLTESKSKGITLGRQSLSRMDVATLFKMPDAQRRQWYIDKLGPFENQLKESANNNVVPVQLLATVILNELADISAMDLLQSDLGVYKGSLGIAQIQIDTALKDNLFSDITTEEGKQAYQEMVIAQQYSATGKLAARLMQTEDKEKRMAINKRLQIPQYAIEATAKEIRILLDRMMLNLGADWQTRAGFVHKGITAPGSAQAIYSDVGGASQLEKEMKLSKLITGAYNSPGIIAAANSAEAVFPNANIHGSNSTLIAIDLYNFSLFRP